MSRAKVLDEVAEMFDRMAAVHGNAKLAGRYIEAAARVRAMSRDEGPSLPVLMSCAPCRHRDRKGETAVCLKGASAVRFTAPPPDDCPLRGPFAGEVP